MEVQKVLKMNPGNNETSYAKNSSFQKLAITKSRRVMENILRKTWNNEQLPRHFRMADLGCSTGPNALLGISYVIDIMNQICDEQNSSPPEFEVYLNDLPHNDFNTLFKLLLNFHNIGKHCFVSGLPGSFYNRLFPSQSIHFISSFTALHWLSKVPDEVQEKNKGDIHISTLSPPDVFEAYSKQFESDFYTFLRLRAEEIKLGGLMVLTLQVRKPFTKDGLEVYSILAEALLEMSNEGVLEEAKVDGFNIPIYTASMEEVEGIIQKEGSFKVDNKLEIFELSLDTTHNNDNCQDINVSARIIKNLIRAGTETMLASHFGTSFSMDDLFAKFEKHLANRLSQSKLSGFYMVVALTRNRF